MALEAIFPSYVKNRFALEVLKTTSLSGSIIDAVAIVLRGDRGLKQQSSPRYKNGTRLRSSFGAIED